MITDCCSIDVFVYATYDYSQGKYNLIEYLEHERLILLSLGDYDKFFYIPAEFEITEDSVRDTNKQYQKDIDNLFKVIFDKYNIEPTILKGTIEERKKTFLKEFGMKLSK